MAPPVPDNEPASIETSESNIPHDLDNHLAQLSTFLTLHIANLTALKNELSPKAQSPPPDVATHVQVNTLERDTLADQFNVIVVTATFTSGAIIAFLSLMQDVFTAQPRPLFSDDSPFVSGLIFGIIAFGLNLAVAIFASVNSALATHYRGDPSQAAPDQRTQLILCSCGQFIASIFTGVAILVLTFGLIQWMAITTSICYFAGLVISVRLILRQLSWKKSILHSPLVAASLTISTLTFGFSTTLANLNSYLFLPASSLTLLYHVMALSQAGFSRVLPHVVSLLLICVLWGAGVVATATMSGFRTQWPQITQCALGSVECIILAIIALRTLSMRKRRETLAEEVAMLEITTATP